MIANTSAPCLFLSHSGADTDAARELKQRILSSPDAQQANLRVWLDKDDLGAGFGWQAQLERAITEEATAFAVHVGAKGIVNWVESEVRLGLSRARNAPDFPFIPILARECSGPELLPAFAREYQAVRDPLNNSEELQSLLAAVLRRRRDKNVVLLDDPFIGLNAMKEWDSERFFGRSEEVAELIDKLKGRRMIAIVAESGAGKSSLAQAGLIPRFRGGVLADTAGREPHDRLWHVVVMRPGRDPVEGLKEGVTETAERLGRSGDQCAGLRRRIEPADPSETAYAIRCDLPTSRTETLLIIDQFEELLTETPEPKRAPFVDLLMKLVAADGFRIVLTLRADYFNLCRPLSSLFEYLSNDNHACIVRLRRITDEGINEAVREPLRLAGHTDISEQNALMAAIRRDVSDRAGDLALVQMALYAMWQKHRSDGSGLVVAYNQTQGVAGALAYEAEQVRIHKLHAGERNLLLPIFVRLVRLGETGGATRRAADLADFDAARQVLALKLASKDCGRLLLAGDTTVEISHEALITQWPWLQNMLQEAAGEVRVLDRLTDKAKRWTSEARSVEHLVTGAEREEFAALVQSRKEWASAAELQLVETSTRAYRASFFKKVAATAAVLTFGIVAALLAYRTNEALQETTTARDQLLSFQSLFLADLANQSTSRGDAGTAILLALEALPDISSKKESGKRRPFVPEAEAALFRANIELHEKLVFKGHESSLWTANLASDARRLITASEDKTARLWDVETGQQLQIFRGHTGPVRFATFSPDGQNVVTTSADRTARLWSVKSENELTLFKGHTEEVLSAAFSLNGQRLVTASTDNTARIWDVRTGKEMFRLDRHTNIVRVAAVSSDGKFVVTASDDSTAHLWDLRTGSYIRSFEGHTDAIRFAAFDSQAMRLVTTSLDKTARVWDLASGAMIMTLTGHTSAVHLAAFSSDGRKLATASLDGTILVWNTQDWRQTDLTGHAAVVRSVQFSRRGDSLVTGSDDFTARIWDVETGKLKAVAKGHMGSVRAATFDPSGKLIFTSSSDGTARLWSTEAEARKPTVVLRGHRGPVKSANFSFDRRYVVTASEDQNAIVWNLQTGEQRTLSGHGGPVLGAVFSPDGRLVATASMDGTARIWEAETGTQVRKLESDGREVFSVVFSPDGTQVAIAASDGSVQLHQVDTGHRIRTFKGHKDNVYGIAFGPGGKQIVTTGEDQTIRFWDIGTGLEIRKSNQTGDEHWAGIKNAAISSDAKYVVTVGGDDTPRLWDANTGVLLAVLYRHHGTGLGVGFSPDGKRLATAADDGSVRVWDTNTGKTTAVLEGHAKVWNVAFSGDGEWIVTATEDHVAQLWPLPTRQQLIDRSKTNMSRCLTPSQRKEAFLESEPPDWCIVGKKWPYHTLERSKQILGENAVQRHNFR